MATLVIVSALAIAGTITGWGLLYLSAIAMVAWLQTAEIVVARRTRTGVQAGSLEWAGVDVPFTEDDLLRVNAALRIETVSP